ncbi:MAG: DUF2155 domain-containing protein [Alphaproteobacteria bacterium]|nr:DUF2155 domain-containing protein [Alphaproteobacteria bacterium]
MNTAVMQAMDKITGHVDLIEVPVNQEVLFGSFSILVRDCKTSAPEETPENFAFVDIVDNISSDAKINIFKGWMVSSSPALNPVAHPVYDVWLLKCSNKPSSNTKPLSEKELALRDDIAMSRAPKKEIISLAKDVYDDIESELQQTASAPENLIPEELVEEQPEPVEPKIENDNVVIENGVTQDSFEDAESSGPEALVIIKEEPREKMETTAPVETVPSEDNVSNLKNETDVIELEKELSEKVISD